MILRRVVRILVIAVLTAITTLLLLGIVITPLRRGYVFRQELITSISTATAVRITEHSNEWDFIPPKLNGFKEEIFIQRNLTPKEIENLKQAFGLSLDFTSPHVGSACAFQDHHRIEAIQPDLSIFRLDVCFHCGEIRINNGQKRGMPLGWASSLRRFFRQMGMKPNGNFHRKES